MNVRTLLEHAAQQWPSRLALIDDATGDRYTFSELTNKVFSFAAYLQLEAGLPQGSRVALLGDAGAAFIVADYGTMSAGMVRVCVDPALALQEIANQLLDAEASLLLYGPAHAGIAEGLRAILHGSGIVFAALSSLDQALAGRPARVYTRCRAEDIAAFNYTGGTTGLPKAVVHTHGSFSAALQNIAMVRAPWTGATMLNVRPLWPIASISLLGHLLNGGTLVLGDNFEPARFLELVEKYRPSCTSLVPTHLVRILRQLEVRPTDLGSLQCIEVSAAAMPDELYRQAIAAFGPVFSVLYGLTEAPWSCYRTPPEGADVLAAPEASHGMVGAATFGCELAIAGPQGHLPAGELGEILIGGAHLMSGYWKQPALTAEVIRDGWFHTGDLGFMDERGRICVRGRIKDIIRSGGKSVQPREVEETLCEHPSVLEAAVVGVADAEWGEAVSAAIVLKPGCHASEDELASFCRQRLSGHKRPKQFIFVDTLPRSHYGKVQHGKIREAILSAKGAPRV